MGAAAAMQALKSFTSGNSNSNSNSNNNNSSANGGGDMKSMLLGKAMAEAAQLFDKNGGAGGGGQAEREGRAEA